VKDKRRLNPSSTTLALGTTLLILVLGLTAAIAFAQTPADAGPQAADIVGSKSVAPDTIEAGQRLDYTLIFTNTSANTITLDSITDVLPPAFLYVGLAAGTTPGVKEASDTTEPEIVWTEGLTVPAAQALRVVYYVFVPSDVQASTTPYTNTVTAKYGAATVGPVEAGVLVVAPDVKTSKTVTPTTIQEGDKVTYTVVFRNEGNQEAVLDAISDTLPTGFVFEDMLPGGLQDDPSGVSGTIVWNGPYTIGIGADLTLIYKVKAESFPGVQASNEVMALLDGETTDPASATVELGLRKIYLPLAIRNWAPPAFGVTKEASAAEVVQGDPVVYTVKFTNYGTEPGTISEIRDTLPPGFVFQSMEGNSDVAAAPTGATGTIFWTGPFQVAGGQTLTLIYKVQTPSEATGDFENVATATTSVGSAPRDPGTATVIVKEPYLLQENFEAGREDWEPFLNYWRLNPDQWYLQAGDGYTGSTGMNHDLCRGITDPRGCERGAHDALLMYEGEGAEEWTNYSLSARVILRDGEKGEQIGLWFRGKYTPPADPAIDGKYVEGYYLVFRPRPEGSRSIVLSKLKNEGGTAYHFSDPETIAVADRPMYKNTWYQLGVDVQGSTIKVYVDGEQVLNVTDNTWSQGTVGFFCYKIFDATWDDVVVLPLP